MKSVSLPVMDLKTNLLSRCVWTKLTECSALCANCVIDQICDWQLFHWDSLVIGHKLEKKQAVICLLSCTDGCPAVMFQPSPQGNPTFQSMQPL